MRLFRSSLRRFAGEGGPERLASVFLALGLLVASTVALPSVEGAGEKGLPSLSHPVVGSLAPFVSTARAQAGPTVAWSNLSSGFPASPPSRCCAAAAYDVKDGVTVLFGGSGACGTSCGDTWVFNDYRWTKLTPPSVPSPRSWAQMAYDPVDGYLVLFGGLSSNGQTALGDTWGFSAGSWFPLTPATSPPARWSGGISSDLTAGGLVLFGGYSNSQGFLGDTWTYSRGNWTEQNPAHAPGARWAPTMGYDLDEQGTLLFGGYGNLRGFLGDTWIYAQGDWRQVPTGTAPPPREKASATYDPFDHAWVLFGGDLCPIGCGTGNYRAFYNDTWVFANGLWTNETREPSPPAECCGVLTYDWTRGRTLFLGSDPSMGGNTTLFAADLVPRPPTLVLSLFEATPQPVAAGTELSLIAAARSPDAPLNYAYGGLPPGCTSSDNPLLTCASVSEGSFTVAVQVTDSGGHEVNDTVVLQVASPPPPVLPPPVVNPWAPVIYGGMAGVLLLLVLAALTRWRFRSPPPEATRAPATSSLDSKQESSTSALSPSSPPERPAEPPSSRPSDKT